MKSNAPKNTTFSKVFPFLLIIVGSITFPVGLLLLGIGVFLVVVQTKNNKDSDATQENQAETPSPFSVPTTSPAPSPTEATATASQKKTETHRVAGINFRLDEIKDLMDESYAYSWTKKELVEEGRVDERVYKFGVYYGTAALVPEPDNPHDPKAIKVLTAGVHIGYIKAGSCAHIHKILREDRIEKVEVEIKGGDYKIVLEDYDDYTGKSTYTLERDAIPFSAVLTVTLK